MAKAGSEKAADSAAALDVAKVRALLKAMVEAYAKASSYQDVAEISMRGRVDGKPFSEKWNYGLTMERPNKLRLHVYQGTAVCDGTNLLAWVAGIPNQVLKIPAPRPRWASPRSLPTTSWPTRWPTDRRKISPGFRLQMILLYSQNPLDTLALRGQGNATA